MTDEEFADELALAAAGDWEAVGLDPPEPDPAALPSGAGVPVTIDEFLEGAPDE